MKFMHHARQLVSVHLPAHSHWRTLPVERLHEYLVDYRDRYDANSGYIYGNCDKVQLYVDDVVVGGRDRGGRDVGRHEQSRGVCDDARERYPRLDDAGFESMIANATDQRTLDAFFWRCLWLNQITTWPPLLSGTLPWHVPALLERTTAQTRDFLLAGNAVDASLCGGYRLRAGVCNLCTKHAACWWEEPTEPAGQGSRATTACWACKRHHLAIIEALA